MKIQRHPYYNAKYPNPFKVGDRVSVKYESDGTITEIGVDGDNSIYVKVDNDGEELACAYEQCKLLEG